jgi:LacI family transcriptional regulator
MGIEVPKQLSVAGFDDISLAQQIYPALTTIRQPLSSMAERAATMLIGHSRKQTSLRGIEIMPATLVIRDSTAPVPE